jgi:XRE family transcriptional regulator, regulator of sulfur utilization
MISGPSPRACSNPIRIRPGTVEHLYLLAGEVEVTTGEMTKRAKTGETLRFRGDLPHRIENVGEGDAHATMVLVLRQLGGPEASSQ